jgi:hypothetical protein
MDARSSCAFYIYSRLSSTEFAHPEGRPPLTEILAGSPSIELSQPAQRLLSLLLASDTATIVVEDSYVDVDHRAALSRFYRLRHFDTQARCKRLHFFAAPVALQDLDSLSNAQLNSYRGFVVIRPFAHATLGRSILSHRLAPASHQPGLTQYITCSATFSANLAGNRLECHGTPWLQQDRIVSACASAAMWVCTWHLGHFLGRGHRLFTTPEITDLSTEFNLSTGRAMPSGGLNVDQMSHGFRAMSYEPILVGEFSRPTPAVAAANVYAYIESGVPVLLSLQYPGDDGHAIAVVGHQLHYDEPYDPIPVSESYGDHSKEKLYFRDASTFVPRFVIQDDAGGPFRYLQFLDPSGYDHHPGIQRRLLDKKDPFTLEFESFGDTYSCGAWISDDPASPSDGEFCFLTAILIPTPPRVTLAYDYATRKAESIVLRYKDQFASSLEEPVVLRSYLRESSRFKADCIPSSWSNPSFASALRRHPMPKWIWVTEVSDTPHHRESQIAGVILLDAAGVADADPTEDLVAVLSPSSLLLVYPDGSGSDSASLHARSELLLGTEPVLYPRFERPASA